tara:strand:- start:730 stop:1011 length:282 start_codon:yes stop_codon:yes gene_type:complete
MKLTTEKLKQLIKEELDNMAKGDEEQDKQEPMQKDVENVLAQFKPMAQRYIDKIDNAKELQQLLKEIVKMLMQKGLTVGQFKSVAMNIIRELK